MHDPFELRPIFESFIPDNSFETVLRPSDQMLEAALWNHYQQLPPEQQSLRSFDEVKAVVRAHPDQVDSIYRGMMPTMKLFVRDLTPRIRKMMIDVFSRMIGILSLTESPTSAAMWDHYADNHGGFILAFDTSHGFFHRQRSERDEFNHLRRVHYLDRSKTTASLIELTGNDMFFSKDLDWAYEREWRMITPLQTDSANAPADDAVVLFDFPPTALLEVIIGARASDVLRNSLSNCLRSDVSFSHVRIREAYIPDGGSAINFRDSTE